MSFTLKRAISIVLVMAVLLGMVNALAAGTTTDPLISRNYLEGTYRTSLKSGIDIALAPVITAERNRLAEINRDSVGFTFAPMFNGISADSLNNIVLRSGASFTMTSGTATININRGTVINLSTGRAVTSGSQLARNERYFCAENTTATIVASSSLVGYVDGYHKIELRPTSPPASPPPSTSTSRPPSTSSSTNPSSQRGIQGFVTRLYVEGLGRNPDRGGLNHWMSILENGGSGTTVAHGIIFSTEMQRRNLSNADFVEVLYRSLLGRNSDLAGRTFWINRLNSGASRVSVFYGFTNSPEFGQISSAHGIRR